MDLKRIKKYILASQAHEIALRVFVMNSFDGILAIMGVVIGAHLSRVSDPRVVITTGIGGSVALGISGICSAYMAESAARKMKQKKLEGAMLKSLDDTQLSRASKFAMVLVALVNGISPAAGGMILLLPYVLAPSATVLDPFYASLPSPSSSLRDGRISRQDQRGPDNPLWPQDDPGGHNNDGGGQPARGPQRPVRSSRSRHLC